MGTDDQREYITFYGLYTDDWEVTFGEPVFENHHYLLKRNYISEGCSTTESSLASDTHKFIYADHLKKIYFIEGVIDGEICFAANGGTATITSYRVSICKIHSNGMNDEELETTDWVTVNDTLAWDAGLGVGEEMVYYFSIDIWDEKKIGEEERIYLKIETNCNSYTYLMHSNDKSWTDIWVDIPFRL